MKVNIEIKTVNPISLHKKITAAKTPKNTYEDCFFLSSNIKEISNNATRKRKTDSVKARVKKLK